MTLNRAESAIETLSLKLKPAYFLKAVSAKRTNKSLNSTILSFL